MAEAGAADLSGGCQGVAVSVVGDQVSARRSQSTATVWRTSSWVWGIARSLARW
ncbi:hypothetical protein F441_10805 [Phytophthora nicotianae CJ01A1]|uniref:Uncharacterized protein n=4 Tax=Phytophthora nicotianae TaxID=4792 RepID=V9F010_PHYNI|nr:hypothetical protein F443_10879 [Phytophthora nicotianae P1569]ETK84420.1 hypothetical protein L915_10615 [Phytophthora nicotianae]ETO73083.1 hypothetical protein F444_10939 [Phytophthora nicotianae P1976]ETP14214.1 hypothetical protein F441_10805 [Phytophthora nicotianae CJ01A1]ETL37860.1 hypothetical protein L916_10505 [Phytophthora nicotianae]